MSNNPENRVQDQRVTDAYRALADERAPEHLNEQVLKLAAEARTPYARARAWMRPAAWAATIGLSLAIVLELTQMPISDLDVASMPPTSESDAAAHLAGRDNDAALPTRVGLAEPPAPVSNSQTDTADQSARKRSTAQAPLSLETASMDDIAPRAEKAMEEAEALARARAGSDNSYIPAPAKADALQAGSVLREERSTDIAADRREAAYRQTARRDSEETRSAANSFAPISLATTADLACAESERETADTWLACIRQLRENGQDEQADEEYEEFRQVYPDFDDSVIDK
jgi:hypothetical protein